MKVIDLINAQPVLKGLTQRRMPAKLAYAIAKNFRLITSELEDYEKARIKLLSDNWPLNEETNKYDIPEEEQSKWELMYNDLLQMESGYKPYVVDMTLTEEVEWTPSELLNLWFIFEGNGSEDLAPKK